MDELVHEGLVPVISTYPQLCTRKECEEVPKVIWITKKRETQTQLGKDRDQDACDICLIQTVKHTYILRSHMLATYCVKGLRAMMGGEVGTARIFVFVDFLLKVRVCMRW